MPGWKRMVSYRDRMITDLQPLPAAVRTPRWRLVNEGTGWQLYDMIADPGQADDVAAENPDVVDRLKSAYTAWFADVTRAGIERPAIPVGYRARPAVELPAPEAYFGGDIVWYNQHGFAHDWLTGWTNLEDTISWDVQVARSGRYQVTLMYTCPPAAVGTTLRVEALGSTVEGTIQKAYNPEPAPRPTRHPKKRFTQTFARLDLGEIGLDAGRQRLTLRALSKPADSICDVKSLWLRPVE
jgi:arylsulfatase A